MAVLVASIVIRVASLVITMKPEEKNVGSYLENVLSASPWTLA